MMFETVSQRYRTLLKKALRRSPFRIRAKSHKAFSGVVFLTEEEFAAAERTLLEPGEPTESIKRGAALLDKLYGQRS